MRDKYGLLRFFEAPAILRAFVNRAASHRFLTHSINMRDKYGLLRFFEALAILRAFVNRAASPRFLTHSR
jgi:hypothetical protein